MGRNRVQKRMDEKSKVKVQVKSEENQEPNKEIFRDRPGPARGLLEWSGLPRKRNRCHM